LKRYFGEKQSKTTKICCDRREKRRGRKKERVAKAECLPVYREAKRGGKSESTRLREGKKEEVHKE